MSRMTETAKHAISYYSVDAVCDELLFSTSHRQLVLAHQYYLNTFHKP